MAPPVAWALSMRHDWTKQPAGQLHLVLATRANAFEIVGL